MDGATIATRGPVLRWRRSILPGLLAMPLFLLCVAIGLAALGSAFGKLPLPPPLAVLEGRLPFVFRIHMVAGGVGMLLVPLALALRHRPWVHRPLGRVTAAVLLIAAVAGLPSALLSEANGTARLGFAAQAALCVAALASGWHAIRCRDAVRHARWMTRAAAILSGVIWLRLMVAAAVMLSLPFDAAYAAIAWSSWLLPLLGVLLVQRVRGPRPAWRSVRSDAAS